MTEDRKLGAMRVVKAVKSPPLLVERPNGTGSIYPGFVSVWVGDFRSEDDFDDYLLDSFATEFGIAVRPQAVREMGVEPDSVAIEKLVRGFSRASTFEAKVIAAARTKGITMASCMFIIYNFKYDSTCQVVANPQVKFIGAVPFPGFG